MNWARAVIALPLVILLLILIHPGCGGNSDESSNHVVIVGSAWYGHAPAWIGIEEGIFEKAGLDVEFKVVAKSAERLPVIASGDAHFASLGEIAMLTHMAHGNDTFYWVGNQNIAPGFEALVGRPGVKTWEDLRGKRIGLTAISSVDITVRLLLAANGLDPEEDVEILNVDPAAMAEAFRSGAVDAAAIWKPYLDDILRIEGVTVLGWDTDTSIYEKFKTMTGPDVLVMSRRWADADPARAKKFMQAYFEAVARLKAAPDEMAKMAVERGYVQESVETVAAAFRGIQWLDGSTQKRVMSDEVLFGQADHVCLILRDNLKQIRKIPAFRDWVKPDLIAE